MKEGLLWEELILNKFIKDIAECTDGLKVNFSKNVNVWNYDQILRRTVEESECPCSADCFFTTKERVVFIEFKKGSRINKDQKTDIENKIKMKIIDTALIYRYFLSKRKEFIEKKVEFWIVMDEPYREPLSIMSTHSKQQVEIPGFLKRFKAIDKCTKTPLYFDDVRYFTCDCIDKHIVDIANEIILPN